MRTNLFLTLIFSLLFSTLFGQMVQDDSLIVRKVYTTSFAKSTPKIDADLSDDAWKEIPVLSDFRQCTPVYNIECSQRTEVRLIYDNTAIYIAAVLYDSHPDSIAKQLGLRDDDINADNFRVVFDTYNTQQDAFDFAVTASGVQMDSRFSDGNYNAVWESKTKITEQGWIVEIKIPYSALRFPIEDEHIWGFQVTRNIVRNGEFSQWALTPRGVNNPLQYWGLLKGIKNIKAPLRLSLTPFITAKSDHYPANIEGESNFSQEVVGGMDLKYGLNESYTLDMSLLPDFSQVQSDNLVKNLGAFQPNYDEQRPFFQENTDLFNRGGLFYSRRIGRQPSGFYGLDSYLQPGETVISNPSAAKLLNITKVSGRSKEGVGLGLLNAVLNNTYATVRDSLGNERQVLTEPFSNYNIAVIDKQLKHSSSVYLINTNVFRNQGYQISNVTGAGADLNNKNNTYSLSVNGAVTNVFNADSTGASYKNVPGYFYGIGFRKSSGKFKFDIGSQAMSPTFNNNDMGITQELNFIVSQFGLNYSTFEPFGNFFNAGGGIGFAHEMNYTTHTLNNIRISMFGYATRKNFNNYNFFLSTNPLGQIDYYEPRTADRYFVRTPNLYSNASFNSDYRKKATIGIGIWGGSTALVSPSIGYNPFYGFDIGPKYRATDKLTISANGSYGEDNKDRGYVNTDTNGDIIFGVRVLKNVSYDFTVRYMFNNNLSLSLTGRHYWVRGKYLSFHNLSEDGFLLDETTYYQNHDFNYNAVNINMLLEWRFAPGSFASLSWKNNINHDSSELINSYGKNVVSTINANQLNTVSLRILYYFDYLYLRKKGLTTSRTQKI